MSHKMCR